MNQKINIQPDPCFDRIRKTLLLEGKPDRLPLCDFWVDRKIMEWVIDGPAKGVEYTCGAAKYDCLLAEQQLEFWFKAGYDYAHVRPYYKFELNDVTQTHGSAMAEGFGIIQTMEDLHSRVWPWQKPEEFGYQHMVDLAKIIPSEMKLILSTGDIFTRTWESMGFTHFCNSLYEDIELIEILFHQMGEAVYKLNVDTIDRIGDKIGAIWYTDDLAFNTGCFINPEVYRKYLFPWVKKLVDLAKSLNVPFLYHTDGALWQIFNDFDVLGINAIHPLEPKSMEAEEVKQKWGHRFCLVGNIEIDTLARGTAEEVDELVRTRIEKLGYNGGYCIGSSNTLASYVNPLNFKAMVEATFKYQK